MLALKYSKLYLHNLERDTLNELRVSGKFVDPREAAVEIAFIPKLVALATEALQTRLNADSLAAKILAY